MRRNVRTVLLAFVAVGLLTTPAGATSTSPWRRFSGPVGGTAVLDVPGGISVTCNVPPPSSGIPPVGMNLVVHRAAGRDVALAVGLLIQVTQSGPSVGCGDFKLTDRNATLSGFIGPAPITISPGSCPGCFDQSFDLTLAVASGTGALAHVTGTLHLVATWHVDQTGATGPVTGIMTASRTNH